MAPDQSSTATTPWDYHERSRLLDLEALAALLNCSRQHARRLANEGRVPPPVRLGRLLRWDAIAIQRWIDDGCPSSVGAPESRGGPGGSP